jgi:dTDP-4-dehydrorhamnose reductase
MEKLLVVGVDTTLGANLALTSADRCEVLGVSSHHPLACDSFAVEHVRHGDIDALTRLADEFRPSWILHCGSLSASSWDLPVADPAWERESQIVRTLLNSARAQDARLTVVLTDAVFTGPRMFHDESSPTVSRHPAAAHALAIEHMLADTIALVVRTHAYGWAPASTEPGTAERIWQALSTGAGAAPDGRRYATPILASDLAELLHRACQLNLQGLLHLTGAERTSPFRMATEMAAACGLPAPRGHMGLVDTPADGADWLSETSLSSRRGRRILESAMPMLREGLQRFAEQAHNGWRERSRLAKRLPAHEQAA